MQLIHYYDSVCFVFKYRYSKTDKINAKTDVLLIATVNEWLTSFEQRILPFMKAKSVLDDSEIVRLGKKVSNEYPYCFD